MDLHEVTAVHTSMEGLRHVEDVVVKAGGAVLRYGAFYGPVELIRKRQFPLVGWATGYASWVHLDDAASATVLALEQKTRGVFTIVDDDPAPASGCCRIRRRARAAKKSMRVPKWPARPLAGQAAVIVMTEGRGFSNAKAKRELGWQPRSPSGRQGFKEEIA